MIKFADNETDEKLLYQLFESHVKKQLKDKLQPEVERILDECVDAAVDSMKANLHQHYDMLNDHRLIKIILEKKNV